MKNTKNHIKVLTTLSIAASETREDTLISIIIRTLFVKGEIAQKELLKKIQEEFNFEPYEVEINPLVEKLIDNNKITVSKGKITLSSEEIESVKKQEITLNDEDKVRFQNFKNFIIDTLEEDLDIKKIKFLWSVFLEYLYDSFYEYGYDALKTLHPYIDTGKGKNGTYEDVLQKSIARINGTDESLIIVFKEVVEKFPDFASEEDIEFLNSLAQKTLSFSSLGLKPELAYETIDHNIVDWVLYLDTNVLYSLLNLHSHPENQACHALIELIQSNKEYIQIKLRYSEQTYRELGSKKADFSLLDDNMTDSAIKALLKSKKLDDFSSKFYQDLLENREETIHPSKVVELSSRTLKQDLIEIGRTGKRLEKIGADYIESRMTDYFRFIEDKNRTKQIFCEEKKINFYSIYRSDRQVRHDVSLREILIDSRNVTAGKDITLNNVKFFAVTLDELLIAYDKAEVKDYHDERSFPVFFKPSFLLNKLIKVLPIQTPDYKKAFIKAITTKGFYRNIKKSKDILKIVNYLKSKGIDDEKVIYNLIAEDLFLGKFKEHSEKNDFNAGEFIESELNREFKARLKELEKTKKELESTEEKSNEFENKYETLNFKKNELETDLNQYKNALKKITYRVKELEEKTVTDKQININFEAAEERIKAESEKGKADILKASLKASISAQIESIRNVHLSKWQKKVWWNLFWVIPLIVVGCFLLIPNDIFYIEIPNKEGEKSNIISIILGVIAFLSNSFFFKLLHDRYFNEPSKKSRRENAIIPEHLMQRLDELNG